MTTDLEMSIDEIERVVGFLGYGKSADSVWFIGKEEGLGNMGEDDAFKNLRARAKFDSVMDLYHAHLELRENGSPIDFERKIPSTQVWKFMAKIMRAREGCGNWADRVGVNEYIRTQLGRSEGQTFLTELSPIPASDGGDKRWMQMFKQMDPQLDTKIRRRREKLKQRLNDGRPSMVICYGHTKAAEFADLLGIKWEPISAKAFKSADSKCLLLPFFGQGQMSRPVIEDLLRADLLR
jgi:hypothetical protein